jgi:hypothetical protein
MTPDLKDQDRNNMTCAEFQSQMPELIGSGEDLSAHPHLKSCELCSALYADLESIAEAARQLFPIADPPDSLWDKLKSAIESDQDAPAGQHDEKQAAAAETELAAQGNFSPGLAPELA